MSIEKDSFEQAVKVYKALGEPTRLRIMQLLCQTNALSCTEIGDRLSQVANSTLSHHLKQLKDCGLVECYNKGTYHYYRRCTDTLQTYAPSLLD